MAKLAQLFTIHLSDKPTHVQPLGKYALLPIDLPFFQVPHAWSHQLQICEPLIPTEPTKLLGPAQDCVHHCHHPQRRKALLGRKDLQALGGPSPQPRFADKTGFWRFQNISPLSPRMHQEPRFPLALSAGLLNTIRRKCRPHEVGADFVFALCAQESLDSGCNIGRLFSIANHDCHQNTIQCGSSP